MRAPRFTVIFVLLTSFSWSQQYQYPFQNPALPVEARINNMVTQHKYFPDIDLATAGAIHAGINHFLDNYLPGVCCRMERAKGFGYLRKATTLEFNSKQTA